MTTKLRQNVDISKQDEATKRQKDIVKCLKLQKWTITCERLEGFLDEYGLTLRRIKFHESADSMYRYRKPRKHLYLLKSIELRSTGKVSRFGVLNRD